MVDDHPHDAPLLAAEPLARRVAAGDAAAFQELMGALWEPCVGLVRRSGAMRSLSATDDDAREVVTRLMSKLERDSHHALRLYLDWAGRNPDKSFADWLRITVANVARDYARERAGTNVDRSAKAPSGKRLLNDFAQSLPLELGARPPMTDAQTARQLLEFARTRLPPAQLTALEAWLQGATHEGIAEQQALSSPEEAKRLIRAAVAVIRRHFGSSTDSEPT
ncbi:MAG: sigma-70 family RNA polymerase sigma factor [Polyangiaceae bacterium]|nr:sigma-70 family RNA polymerase sigma factor [Polyangiaceae bacterium]